MSFKHREIQLDNVYNQQHNVKIQYKNILIGVNSRYTYAFANILISRIITIPFLVALFPRLK